MVAISAPDSTPAASTTLFIIKSNNYKIYFL